MALGIPVRYSDQAPPEGPWLLYAEKCLASTHPSRCLYLPYQVDAWSSIRRNQRLASVEVVSGLPNVLPGAGRSCAEEHRIGVDILANAFWFLASWSERYIDKENDPRGLYSESVCKKLALPQDIVDVYLTVLQRELDSCCDRSQVRRWDSPLWPDNKEYAVVLSHDVDFIPRNRLDLYRQGAKTVARHLLREQSPTEAARAASGFLRAIASGRDPYGCLPAMISREISAGVQASYSVAVGHRHPFDVNYFVEDEQIRDYLSVIVENGFELCLHGSYRSTDNVSWYAEELEILSERICRPIGSRQHYLSFDYDALFDIQERSGIQYDMSMGYADQVGPRAGFSFPYFPWNAKENRPYDVLQISLFVMDVTLRSYMGLRSHGAWEVIKATLDDVRRKRGGVSVVWHPIVFGNARDPGYGDLFWSLVDHVKATQGLATDGRTVNEHWRERAKNYVSFSGVSENP